MRFPIMMDQHADIMILGENDPPFGDGFQPAEPDHPDPPFVRRDRRRRGRQRRISRTACATMLESARKRTLFRGDRQTFRSR
jgi:hypothetical protein